MVFQMKKAIQILGAGPAGLSAAINLAAAGREVHLYERYDAVGKRFQGDLQGIENWTSKENVFNQLSMFGLKNLEKYCEITPFKEVSFTNGKNVFQTHSEEPLFYLVKRGSIEGSLDNALCRQAKEIGVNIHYEKTIPYNQADIIATGPIRPATIAIDKGLVFQTKLPNMALGIFHQDLAFNGYSYLLVAEGYGCICTVVFKEFQRVNRCFEQTIDIAKRLFPLNLTNAHSVGGIGCFGFNHSPVMGSALLVGEAGGFQDFLWGFGIRSSLTSGHLAARSILEGKDYSILVDNAFNHLLKAGIVNRFLWETCKFQSSPILPYFLKITKSSRKAFHFLYNYSLFHRALFPIAFRYAKKNYPHIFF